MDNQITGLNDPQNSTYVVNKQFVENRLSHYVKTDGTSTTLSSLDVDDDRITGLSLHPVTGDKAIGKKYLDDQIKKTNIKLSQVILLKMCFSIS